MISRNLFGKTEAEVTYSTVSIYTDGEYTRTLDEAMTLQEAIEFCGRYNCMAINEMRKRRAVQSNWVETISIPSVLVETEGGAQ